MRKQELIEILLHCASVCDGYAEADISDDAEWEHFLSLTRDCSDICINTANSIARASRFQKKFIALCLQICAQCAAEFEQHHSADCKECAEACRKCEEACRAILTHKFFVEPVNILNFN